MFYFRLQFRRKPDVPDFNTKAFLTPAYRPCRLQPSENNFYKELFEQALIFYEAARVQVVKWLRYEIARKNLLVRRGNAYMGWHLLPC